MDSNFESVNSTDNIKEILDEVHYSENINECRKKEILIYENEYIISKNEAYEGLKNSGMIKTAGTRIVIYTVILLLAIAGFIAAYVIRNNINGYLVKANDIKEMSNKVNSVLQDDKKLKEFSDKAELDIEKFNINSIIDKWTSLLVSI